MAQEANRTTIGAFVVGAIALLVLGITLFGSGKLFRDYAMYVMFFEGSLEGLTVGSPVEFRGVKIGEVTEIKARFLPKTLDFYIPVTIRIDNDSIDLYREEGILPHFDKYTFQQPLVDKGLRGKLKVKSFITGQMFISLDFYPGTKPAYLSLETDYPQLPTLPSDMQQLMTNIQRIPFNQIADRLARALEGLEKTMTSPEIGKGLKNINKIITDTNVLIAHIDSEIRPLAADLTETSRSARNAFTRAGDLAENLKGTSEAARGAFSQAEKTLALTDGVPGELAAGIREATGRASASLDQIRTTLLAYERLAEGRAGVGYDLRKTLGEIDSAARSLRSLADYLETHPESLIKGKP